MITLILTLALVGVVLWFIEQHLPMDPAIKTLIRIIVVVAVILWLIRLLGIEDLPLPRFRS